MTVKKERFIDIDCLKGLTIILVVIGHIVARDYPIGDSWFYYIKHSIYAFHMPLFIFLSGWVFYYTCPQSTNFKQSIQYIFQRAYRLLVPFFTMGLIVILGKYIAGRILFVDNPVNDLTTGIINLIWNTRESSASFIWYVFVVFVFIAFTFVALRLIKTKWNLFLLIIFALMIKVARLPGYFYLDLIGSYYIYFLLGCLAMLNKEKYYNFIDKYSSYCLAIAIALTVYYLYNDISWLRFFIVIFIVFGLHGTIKTNIVHLNSILKISKYTFTIYLFNVIFIGLSKAILLKFMPWDGVNFFIFLPVLFICGLFGPIVLKKFVFSKIPMIDKLTN